MSRPVLLAASVLSLAPLLPTTLAAGRDGGLSLEARVVGTDGEPVERSSILFWRLVPEPAKDTEGLWRDPEERVWENLGGAATGDRLTRDDLAPGTYRVTAHEGHHESTPVGVGEPVVLEAGQERAMVTVHLRPGPTLTVRPVDAATGEPLPGVSVGLTREGNDLPPTRGIAGSNREGGEFVIEQMPPGTYTLRATRFAGRPEDPIYALAGGDMPIEVEEGVDREVPVPMAGRPLTGEEIEQRWPWMAVGTVTDTEGRPIAGAEVRVATGMGTLLGGGRTTTDEQGHFTLRFAEGVWMQGDGPNTQVAAYSISKPDYVEASRSRPGHLLMARKLPAPDDRFGADPEEIALPGEPIRIDFVLAEPATLDVQLEGPIDAAKLEVVPGGGQDRWGAAKALEGPQGAARRWELLPGQPWQFTVPYREGRFRVRSQPFTLPDAGHYRATLQFRPDPIRGVDVLKFSSYVDQADRDVRNSVLGDDPLARPPVEDALQVRGGEILRRMAEANRLWLGPAPEAVRTYQYRFRFAGEDEGTTYRVGDGPVPGVVRHGVSHVSAIHHLTANPEAAAFRRVEVGEDRVVLTYVLAEPVSVSAGNGVLGTWRGFFSMPIREGHLVLDARTLTPLEHRADELAETFSRFVEVGEGRYAPLAIAVEKGGMHFAWSFRVFEPGLWLLAEAHGERGEAVAVVDEVRVNGEDAEPIAVGVQRD